MEYTQEPITTLHDLTDHPVEAGVDDACVVIPMTERDLGAPTAADVLSTLERVGPGRVVVALRASPDRIDGGQRWLADYDLSLDVLWCTGEGVGDLLDAAGLDGPAGKGRDVWLALGVAAAEHPYVVVHDADTRTYSGRDVPKLLAPLERGYTFTKGYYARVEDDRLYGRLFRLFYAPLVRALRERHDAPVLSYLSSFRYALAGEFATTAHLARRFRIERRFGLEVGSLGDAFTYAGFDGTAQVDLGRYEHDHRAVGGPAGLAAMSDDVGAALFRVLEERGVSPDYAAVRAGYREAADKLIRQYAADAAFNGLSYDPVDERAQVGTYVDAIGPPTADTRLPAWVDVDISPAEVLAASREDLIEAA